jgi:L-threonylcarbamoyladenylate synthase
MVAARYIRDGEVVAFPTETVYGLGANIFDEAAIRRIFVAKGRPGDNPLIAHIADLAQIDSIAAEIPPAARLLIDRFFPGPLTVILPKRHEVPLIATGGLETIGVRMPDHQVAIDLLRACGVPLVAPSANISGRPSPTTWQAVRSDLDGRIACILQGAPTRVGLESTVVDCTAPIPAILRAGAITFEQLREVIPEILVPEHYSQGVQDLADTRSAGLKSSGPQSPGPKSPGMKYRHYSPQARVIVCNSPTALQPVGRSAYIGLDPLHNPQEFASIAICRDIADYAARIFQFFRECDAAGIETIFCQSVEREGLGLALMDRLTKAAT